MHTNRWVHRSYIIMLYDSHTKKGCTKGASKGIMRIRTGKMTAEKECHQKKEAIDEIKIWP